MSPYKRNILVGTTVLTALVLLGWMIVRFSDAPFRFFAPEQMPIRLAAVSAEGLGSGSVLQYKGVTVGRVTQIRRSPDQRYAIIEALVDANPPLPRNLEGRIRSQLLGGGSTITLALVNGPAEGHSPTTLPAAQTGPSPAEVTEPVPVGVLKPNETLIARYVGVDILPPEFITLAMDLRETSQEVRFILRQFRESQILTGIASIVTSIQADVDKAGKVIDAIHSITSDPSLQRDLRQTLANFRTASESAVSIGQNIDRLSKKADKRFDELADNGNKVLVTAQQRIDDLSKQIGDRLTQTAGILETLQSVARKLDDGQGTLGLLANDPKLYESLLDSSKQLGLTLSDLRRLVEQWEQEGLPVRLGGGNKR